MKTTKLKTSEKLTLIAIIILLVSVGSYQYGIFTAPKVTATPGTNQIAGGGSLQSVMPCNYYIFPDSSVTPTTYDIINCDTHVEVSSGTDIGALLNSILPSLALNGGDIRMFQGNYYASTQIVFPASNIGYTLQGVGVSGNYVITGALPYPAVSISIKSGVSLKSLAQIATGKLWNLQINNIYWYDNNTATKSHSLLLFNQTEMSSRLLIQNNVIIIGSSALNTCTLNMTGNEDSIFRSSLSGGGKMIWHTPTGAAYMQDSFIGSNSAVGAIELANQDFGFTNTIINSAVTVLKGASFAIDQVTFQDSYGNPPASNSAFLINNAGVSNAVFAFFSGGQYYADAAQSTNGIFAGNGSLQVTAIGTSFAATGTSSGVSLYTGTSTFTFIPIGEPSLLGHMLPPPTSSIMLTVPAGLRVLTPQTQTLNAAKSTTLTYSLSTNSTYTFQAVIYVTEASGSSVNFQVHSMAAGATLLFFSNGIAGGGTSASNLVTSTGTNIFGTANTVANNVFSFYGIITTSTAATTLQIDFLDAAGVGTTTVNAGSFITIQKIV